MEGMVKAKTEILKAADIKQSFGKKQKPIRNQKKMAKERKKNKLDSAV